MGVKGPRSARLVPTRNGTHAFNRSAAAAGSVSRLPTGVRGRWRWYVRCDGARANLLWIWPLLCSRDVERRDAGAAGEPGGWGALRSPISAAVAELHRDFYGHDRTTATTYLNGNVVLSVLEDILTADESRLVRFGAGQEVIDG